MSEMIIGKDLEEVKKITNKDIADMLGGLPAQKMHCSVRGREALEDALKKYYGEDSEEWQELALEVHSHDHAGEKIICTCFNVTENQIWEAIKVNGLTTVEEVTNYTKAGGACGRCKSVIKDIIDTYLKKNKVEEKVELTPTQKILKMQFMFKLKLMKKQMQSYLICQNILLQELIKLTLEHLQDWEQEKEMKKTIC